MIKTRNIRKETTPGSNFFPEAPEFFQDYSLSRPYRLSVTIDVNGRVNKASREVPGPSVGGDSDWNRRSQGPTVWFVLTELSWISLFIIYVSEDVWAWRGSRLALTLSSIRPGENSVLASSIRSAVCFSDASFGWSWTVCEVFKL